MGKKTIGRKWPSQAPRGDYVAMCDDCGVHFRRSQLREMEDGRLSCAGPGTNGDGDGRVGLTLSRLNASTTVRRNVPSHRGGNYDRDT